MQCSNLAVPRSQMWITSDSDQRLITTPSSIFGNRRRTASHLKLYQLWTNSPLRSAFFTSLTVAKNRTNAAAAAAAVLISVRASSRGCRLHAFQAMFASTVVVMSATHALIPPPPRLMCLLYTRLPFSRHRIWSLYPTICVLCVLPLRSRHGAASNPPSSVILWQWCVTVNDDQASRPQKSGDKTVLSSYSTSIRYRTNA